MVCESALPFRAHPPDSPDGTTTHDHLCVSLASACPPPHIAHLCRVWGALSTYPQDSRSQEPCGTRTYAAALRLAPPTYGLTCAAPSTQGNSMRGRTCQSIRYTPSRRAITTFGTWTESGAASEDLPPTPNPGGRGDLDATAFTSLAFFAGFASCFWFATCATNGGGTDGRGSMACAVHLPAVRTRPCTLHLFSFRPDE